MRVLVLNAGSSTLKASLVSDGRAVGDPVGVDWPAGTERSAPVVGKVLSQLPDSPDAVGYRVVHGGTAYRSPARVDDTQIGRASCRERV